jgi:uncharacterized protein YqhQ
MKSSNIGGQAVLEGIMMKNQDRYAVAVRKPDGEIFVQTETFHSITGNWKKLTTIPFVRGVFNFIDSMVLGIKTLTFSASFYEEEEEKELSGKDLKKKEPDDGRNGCLFHCCSSCNLYDIAVFSVDTYETGYSVVSS